MSLTIDGNAVTFEVALSSTSGTYGRWGRSLWGSFRWGPGVEYVDLSDRIESFRTNRQFEQTSRTWRTGTGVVVLDNDDAYLSARAEAGPYVGTVIPRRPCRLTAVRSGITYTLLTGRCSLKPRVRYAGDGKGHAVVEAQITDTWAEFPRIDPVALDVAVGAGDTFGARVARTLASVGYTGAASIQTGDVTMQATDHSSAIITELNNTAKAEGGSVWVASDGAVMAAGRDDLLTATRSTVVQATFGGYTPGSLSISDPEEDTGEAYICNRAEYTRVGGTRQTAVDEGSRGTYGMERETESGLICETDAQALSLAQWTVASRRQPHDTVSRWTVYPGKDPATYYPVVLGLAERDLVQVDLHPPGGITPSYLCHLSGVEHTVSAKEWRTVFSAWAAEPYTTYANSRWGRGHWGTFRWTP